jgi:membrane protease YdiL (CAAX protease family)
MDKVTIEKNSLAEKQYPLKKILTIWALAAIPGGLLYWLGLPLLEKRIAFPVAYLIMIFTGLGLVWEFILVLAIIKKEEGDIRWPTIKNRLWLQPPSDPKTGKENKKLWLWIIPLIILFAATQIVPAFQSVDTWWTRILPIKEPAQYNSDALFADPAVREQLVGAWGFAAAWLFLGIINMAEELLFRGILLPKMNKAFGRADWFANGVLFAFYHLDRPWAWPSLLIFDPILFALPAKNFKSTWISIGVHFSQTIYFMVLISGLVLGFA